jgi:dipeptidyl aminopeptidase/acylaminoacyl peptidase
MRRIAPLLCCLVVLVPTARAEAPKVGEATARWTVEDVLHTDSVSDFQVSPDGRWVVWAHSVVGKDRTEPVVRLVRLELATGREVVLTRGGEDCTHPRWSPDGKLLAFLSSRAAPKVAGKKGGAGETDEAKSQIWLMDPTGGEPWPLTEGDRGVLHYDWAGPHAIVFVAHEEPSHQEQVRRDEKDDTTVVEDAQSEPPARLFRVIIESKKVTRLSENSDWIDSLAVSPDGRHAVAIHNRSLHYTYDNRIKPAVVLHDLDTGRHRRVFADPKLNVQQVRWAPDGRGFYATNLFNSLPRTAQAGVIELYYHDLQRDADQKVDLDWDRGLAVQEENDELPGFVPTRDGFLTLLADGVRNRVAHYQHTAEGWKREWLKGEHVSNFFAMQSSADGKVLLYAHSTASTPTQWYHARLESADVQGPKAFARINEQLRKLPRARTEVVRWKGALDEEVEGILYYPHGYRPGTKHPLVVMPHGGPMMADLDCWEDSWAHPANLLCQRGAFVLKPNYHGSSNYGLKWLESITQGRYGEPELTDIENGVDALIARGLVDAERLALCGWSNGAILINRLTVRTTRYKAAVVLAGNVEYVSDWATCEFGDAFDRYYFGATPLDDPKLYIRKSPFFHLDRVRTPTLIFFGAEDRVVSTSQGWVQYRALQQLGKAPVRFVLFPGEKHALKKLPHQKRKMEEELTWLDRYLFRTPQPADSVVKKDSPLAWALGRRQAWREGGRFGLLVKETLTPETVAHAGLQVGRFEVTRSQFAQFDRTYRVEPGQEDYPAGGITFEQARAYCAWLSKQTGRTYRLPTEAEGEVLYDSPESGENTLDHWAGYAANPDDTARLREKLKELGGEAPLLRPVGSFRGSGAESLVFDLGGNVAEWVVGKDGGVLRGGSADAPADPKQRSIPAAPAYRGFRVVLEP